MYKLIVIIFLSWISLSRATNYYVDKNATGANIGTSWANAWNSFSNINWNSLNSGDILYISGGSDSTVYNEQLTISKSGVTITRSTDAGHNGTVILDGNNGIETIGILSEADNVVVDGLDRTKFKIRSYANRDIQSRYQDNQTFKNITCYIDLPDMASAIYFYGQEWTTPPVFSNNFTLENITIYQDSGSYTGQGNSDGIQIIGINNVIIRGSNITLQNANNTAHSDVIQMYRTKNVTIENNEFYQLETSATSNKQGLYLVDVGGEIRVRNNYFLHKQNAWGSVLAVELYNNDGWVSTYAPFDSAIITNNTIVTSFVDKPWPIRFHNASGINHHGRGIFKNNIIYYSNVAGAQRPGLDTSVVSPSTVSNNIYWRDGGGAIYIYYNRVSDKSLANWEAWGFDANSLNTDPLLTGYKPSSVSDARDNGVNLSGLGYDYDIEGTTRTDSWDIGAFEIQTGPDVTPPELQGATINSPTQVTLFFSEPLDPQSAQNESNYNINNGVDVISAVLIGNNRDVTLTTTEHNPNQQYTVTVNNVTDLAGNVISPQSNTVQYFFEADVTPPEVTGAFTASSTQLLVYFSEEIESNSASDITNYEIINGVQLFSAELLQDQKTAQLTTSDHTSGQTYEVIY